MLGRYSNLAFFGSALDFYLSTERELCVGCCDFKNIALEVNTSGLRRGDITMPGRE